jgi:hypothetical protein
MPNTRTASAQLHVSARVAADWLLPASGVCTAPRARLEVAAGAPAGVTRVVFAVDGRRRATVRSGAQGIWRRTVTLARGRHTLVATAIDRAGHSASVRRIVKTCNA